PPLADRESGQPRDPPGLPRPASLRRGCALAPAPPPPRARLPSLAARDLRLQRAGAAPRRASGIRTRGRTAEGVLAARRVGRRRPLRARARRSGDMSAAKRWAEAYELGWRAGDGEACAQLYAERCVFRSHPFRELEDARAYMRQVVPEAEAPEVWFGE